MILSRDELIERCRKEPRMDAQLREDLIDTMHHMWLRAEAAEHELDKATDRGNAEASEPDQDKTGANTVVVRLFYQGYEQSGPDTYANTVTSVDVPVRDARLSALLEYYARPSSVPVLAGAEVVVRGARQ